MSDFTDDVDGDIAEQEAMALNRALLGSTDAAVWAREFAGYWKVVRRDKGVEDEETVGLMIGWFANAIETAKDSVRPTSRAAWSYPWNERTWTVMSVEGVTAQGLQAIAERLETLAELTAGDHHDHLVESIVRHSMMLDSATRTLELHHAHVENLIERMAALEKMAGLNDPCPTCRGDENYRVSVPCRTCNGTGCDPRPKWAR